MRILPRGPSSSIKQSGATTRWGISSKKAVGAVGCGLRPEASAIRLSLPYSSRKTLDVRKTPCSRATAAADAHNPSGTGNRPRCDLRQRSNRREIRCIPAGTSNCVLRVIVGPPRPVEHHDRRYQPRPTGVMQACRKLTIVALPYTSTDLLAPQLDFDPRPDEAGT